MRSRGRRQRVLTVPCWQCIGLSFNAGTIAYQCNTVLVSGIEPCAVSTNSRWLLLYQLFGI